MKTFQAVLQLMAWRVLTAGCGAPRLMVEELLWDSDGWLVVPSAVLNGWVEGRQLLRYRLFGA